MARFGHWRHHPAKCVEGTPGPPSRVLVFTVTMPPPEPEVGHDAAARRRSSVAARHARAAAADTNDFSNVFAWIRASAAFVSQPNSIEASKLGEAR